MPYKILVVGDDTRSFLSVVRSLGQAGHYVDVIMHRHNPISACSKYIGKIHRVSPAALDAGKWLSEISQLQTQYNYDLIIPCDDSALVPFMRLPHNFRSGLVATPGTKAFELFYDKQKTLEACRALGIPVAASFILSSDALGRITYPVVLKPCSSFSLDNLSIKQTVSVLVSKEQAEAAIAAIGNTTEYFLEGYFDGVGVGISVLARHGTVLQAFQHERMEEGVSGGSSLRRSVPLNSAMFDDVKLLVKHSGLDGVAMFEFRYNKAGQTYILLEVNARFWGSLPLAIYAGIDFPAMLVEMYSSVVETQGMLAYKLGKVARAFTASFYSFAHEMSSEKGLMAKASTCFLIFLSVPRMVIFREKIDTFSMRDLKPFIREMVHVVGLLVQGISRRLGIARLVRILSAKRVLRQLSDKNAPVKNILVLCYGNICRSPYAEHTLRRALGQSDIRIKSAGFHMEENRASPDDAVNTAMQNGTMLGEHRSRFARYDDVVEADLIIVFDERNELDLAREYPDAVVRSVNFGDLLASVGDIEDPYGKGEEAFVRCYSEIDEATGVLAGLLKAEQYD